MRTDLVRHYHIRRADVFDVAGKPAPLDFIVRRQAAARALAHDLGATVTPCETRDCLAHVVPELCWWTEDPTTGDLHMPDWTPQTPTPHQPVAVATFMGWAMRVEGGARTCLRTVETDLHAALLALHAQVPKGQELSYVVGADGEMVWGEDLEGGDTWEQLRDRLHCWLYQADNGHTWTVNTYDTYQEQGGHRYLGYVLRDNGTVIVREAYVGLSPMHARDSVEALMEVIFMLALKPGDTDEEFFASYTPERLAWVTAHGEELGEVADEWETAHEFVGEMLE